VQRRDFITRLSGEAAVLAPAPAPAQTKVPRLGYPWIGAEGTDGLVMTPSLLARAHEVIE